MIRPLILAALCATPASAATVLSETWGASRSLTDLGGYMVTATETQEAIGESTKVAEFSFRNDTIKGSGHSRSFTWSLFDGETEISGLFEVVTTANLPRDADWFSVTGDLPQGYRWGGADSLVEELGFGRVWIIRDPVAWVEPEQPAPVPVPAAGGLLAAALGILSLRGLRARLGRLFMSDADREHHAHHKLGASFYGSDHIPLTAAERQARADFEDTIQ